MREEAEAKIRELGRKSEEILSEVFIYTDALNFTFVAIIDYVHILNVSMQVI